MYGIPSGPHEVQLGKELIRLIISSVQQRKSFGQKEYSVSCWKCGRHELLKELEKVSLRIWAFCTSDANVVEFEIRVGIESLFLRRERT